MREVRRGNSMSGGSGKKCVKSREKNMKREETEIVCEGNGESQKRSKE